jgi:hypothetical protein
MDAKAKHDAPTLRQAGFALDHPVLHFDGATHGVDNATKLDEYSIAGALNDVAVMPRDGQGSNR